MRDKNEKAFFAPVRQWSVPREPTCIHVKYRPKRFRFAGVISIRKSDLSYAG